jgi:hypothetical protein
LSGGIGHGSVRWIGLGRIAWVEELVLWSVCRIIYGSSKSMMIRSEDMAAGFLFFLPPPPPPPLHFLPSLSILPKRHLSAHSSLEDWGAHGYVVFSWNQSKQLVDMNISYFINEYR